MFSIIAHADGVVNCFLKIFRGILQNFAARSRTRFAKIFARAAAAPRYMLRIYAAKKHPSSPKFFALPKFFRPTENFPHPRNFSASPKFFAEQRLRPLRCMRRRQRRMATNATTRAVKADADTMNTTTHAANNDSLCGKDRRGYNEHDNPCGEYCLRILRTPLAHGGEHGNTCSKHHLRTATNTATHTANNAERPAILLAIRLVFRRRRESNALSNTN